MKKQLFFALLLSAPFQLFSQNDDFNKWSIEANVGMNKPVRPYTEGYFSSNPDKYLNISTVNHYDLGARYMFTNIFGAKLNFGYDKIENQSDSGSLPFESEYYSVGLQGYTNLGNLFNFNSFTKRINLLAHAGIQISQFTPKTGRYEGITEDNGGIIFGITPQVKITDKLVFTADFTAVNNIRQHYNWDGIALSNKDNNLTGLIYTTSVGLTYYLGKNKVHADWYYKENMEENKDFSDDDARKRIDELESMLNDDDRDGVANYLDVQNNTPNGLVVDSKGRFIDENKNGVPDELEKSEREIATAENKNSDAMRSLIEKGYLNIFFDVNQDTPSIGSTENVFQLIQFLKNNPDKKVKLLGYADIRGGEHTNKTLSQRRAEGISKILISSGINKDRITVIAQGIDKSFTTETKANLNLARRVSVVLE